MTSTIQKGFLGLGYLALFATFALAPIFAAHGAQYNPPPTVGSGGSTNPPVTGVGGSGTGVGGSGTGVGGSGGSDSIKLENPLKFDSLTELLSAILDIMMVFAVPIIVFFLILGGFKYVTAQGNSEAIGKATKMITWTLVGGVIVLGAWALVEVIQGTVDALR